MGMDVCRFIEVYTPDYDGYVYDKRDIKNIGKFTVGNVMMIYNSHNKYNYWRIARVISTGPDVHDYEYEYEPIVLPENITECMKVTSELEIIYRCEFYKDLPRKQLPYHDGVIYKCWDHGEKYFKLVNGNWEVLDKCPSSWKQVRWKDADNYITTGCGCFITHYVTEGWGSDGRLAKRGLPEDITETTKSEIYEGEFNFTYATLAEIEQCSIDARKRMKHEILKTLEQDKTDNVNSKLDYIISQLTTDSHYRTSYNTYLDKTENTDDDEEYVSDFDDVFDEMVVDVEMAQAEYTSIDTMVRNTFGYISDEKVRVIYTFNN